LEQARLVPVYVAPNVLSLAGLLCLMQGYYLCFMYMELYPRLVTSATFFLILCYQTLDATAGTMPIVVFMLV